MSVKRDFEEHMFMIEDVDDLRKTQLRKVSEYVDKHLVPLCCSVEFMQILLSSQSVIAQYRCPLWRVISRH